MIAPSCRPVIVMTGFGDIPMSVQAMKAGAMEFLTKPFGDEALDARTQLLCRSGHRIQHGVLARPARGPLVNRSAAPGAAWCADCVPPVTASFELTGKESATCRPPL